MTRSAEKIQSARLVSADRMMVISARICAVGGWRRTLGGSSKAGSSDEVAEGGGYETAPAAPPLPPPPAARLDPVAGVDGPPAAPLVAMAPQGEGDGRGADATPV